MKNIISEQQVEQILQALDEAIEDGPWQNSNFLKIIGRDLKKIRDDFADHVSMPTQEKAKSDADDAKREEKRNLQKKVFIGLYATSGENIHVWERILANLPKQIISRPVYEEEEDVKSLLKTKENKVNQAYVSLFINPNDILSIPEEKVLHDKLGTPLLSLKNKSVSTDNLGCFVHKTGTYDYKNGRLIKRS